MSTKAQQFDILAVGVINNAALITTPYVKFLAAGTSTAKNAWDDKDKSVAITKKALDAQGRAVVYGDGIYDLDIYSGDPDAGGTKLFEINGVKCVAVAGNRRTITTDTTATDDDSLIIANTASGTITVTMYDATLADDRILYIHKSSASNTLTVAPPGGQTINNGASVSVTGLDAVLAIVSDGSNWFTTTGDASTLQGTSLTGLVKYPADTGFNVKIVNIGDWNMDADGTANVSHGLTYSQIRAAKAFVRNDTDTTFYSLERVGEGAVDWGSTAINLFRGAGSSFDSTAFDSTSYNRGYITIWYTD